MRWRVRRRRLRLARRRDSVCVARVTSAAPAPSPKRPLSLGVIFLTLYIDLIGFSIIFPLGPDLLKHYLALEGNSGVLGWLLAQIDALARSAGIENYAPVLFGGVLSSVFSILQFVFAPFWGAVSDRRGRRGVLLLTVAGTALGYLVWAVSGSFWMFLLSRVVTELGSLSTIHPGVVEGLFAADLAFLQDLYRRVNQEGHTRAAVQCPACRHEFAVDVAGGRPGES